MLQETLTKFGYPNSLIMSFKYWHVLQRPAQPTLGSLILICRENVTQYSDVSEGAMIEQRQVIKMIESVLGQGFNYSKINYLMLMMVDPAVHFHVIPRYETSVDFAGESYGDQYWPKPPNLAHDLKLSDSAKALLLAKLKQDFSSYSNEN
ncbi:HIT domain-containing protein [Shewanella gelidii]|uniref:HIT family protein n=1 Tax=Shewanella gelidii TaxID=1642821 RepID=A0A917JS63_9GAMM|nr:HIT domain-containing protein [Shewanella gelidii]MCL1099162.1 hypothetical protein [Shewanella gelidii]GGI81258.1 HIT family protein [Shewanella gelidii]